MEKLRKNYSTKLIWLIPPIVILWNNLHGGVVSGLGLIFMYIVGEFLSKRPWKKYFALLAISTPLLIINPYGLKYLDFLFSATTTGIPNSSNCVVKNKLLLKFVASTILMIPLGRSFKKNSLVTISSLVYGDME